MLDDITVKRKMSFFFYLEIRKECLITSNKSWVIHAEFRWPLILFIVWRETLSNGYIGGKYISVQLHISQQCMSVVTIVQDLAFQPSIHLVKFVTAFYTPGCAEYFVSSLHDNNRPSIKVSSWYNRESFCARKLRTRSLNRNDDSSKYTPIDVCLYLCRRWFFSPILRQDWVN